MARNKTRQHTGYQEVGMGRDQEDLCLQKRLCRQLRQQPNVCVPATQQNQALGVFDNVVMGLAGGGSHARYCSTPSVLRLPVFHCKCLCQSVQTFGCQRDGVVPGIGRLHTQKVSPCRVRHVNHGACLFFARVPDHHRPAALCVNVYATPHQFVVQGVVL